MKKMIAFLLALCLVMSLGFAVAENDGLKAARLFVKSAYQFDPEGTPKDYTVIGTVPGQDETYIVEWTTDSDTIVITRQDDGMVKIDVNESNPKELAYVLTATLKDSAGNEASVSFNRVVPAAIFLDVMTEEEIVNVAYDLEAGAFLPAATALHGKIVNIPSADSEKYGNITVDIQIGDLADKPIQCYRLTGEGVDKLAVGDEIAVAGNIKNYNGKTIEFDAGCFLIPVEEVASARVALYAYSIEAGATLDRTSTMTGTIVEIADAYSEKYGNITVNIVAAGLNDYVVQCYRLTGEGADKLAVGDVITVTGKLMNYKGTTIEFASGCTFTK